MTCRSARTLGAATAGALIAIIATLTTGAGAADIKANLSAEAAVGAVTVQAPVPVANEQGRPISLALRCKLGLLAVPVVGPSGTIPCVPHLLERLRGAAEELIDRGRRAPGQICPRLPRPLPGLLGCTGTVRNAFHPR